MSIERSRREHEELLAEFESLLVGVEATMQASELGPRRLTDQEMFLEAKRALNPLEPDERLYTQGEDHLEYRSARQQLSPQGSCYACLRSYGNQFKWDKLSRGPIAIWTAALLAANPPRESKP